MYSQDKINVALKVYHQCGSVTTTIRVLGYPTRRALYTWIANEGVARSERKPLKLPNTAEHPRNPSVEVKMNAICRCFELGESIKLVSEDIGYTRASIYSWRKKYLHVGITALMNDKTLNPILSRKAPHPQHLLPILLNYRLRSGICRWRLIF